MALAGAGAGEGARGAEAGAGAGASVGDVAPGSGLIALLRLSANGPSDAVREKSTGVPAMPMAAAAAAAAAESFGPADWLATGPMGVISS